MEKILISQSLMKDLQSYYQKKECGSILKAKYVDNVLFESSDVMRLGQYFEYIATGQLPKGGQIPEPEILKSGKKSVAYERADLSGQYAKVLFEKMGIEIISTGEVVKTSNKVGTLDILARWNNTLCVIDLKYTGLLDNKWDERGWHLDTLSEKDKLMIQAVHYKSIVEEKYEEDVDFYFFLFSSTDPNDVRIVNVVVDNTRALNHEEDVKKAQELWSKLTESNNFKNYPELSKCSSCPLKETCQDRALLPTITYVYY